MIELEHGITDIHMVAIELEYDITDVHMVGIVLFDLEI